MSLTPVEIRHVHLRRGVRGYKRDEVDKLLLDVAASFEDVWRERADLADHVEQLEADLVRYRELESLLRATLVSAERAAAELKEQARRESELVVGEAHAEARAIARRAAVEHERLRAESVRLRERLRIVLETLDEAEDGTRDQGDALSGEARAA
jgi:cell division initiation protein